MSNTTVFCYTMSRAGEVGAWSRYVFPFVVDHFTMMGDKLYIRAGDDVLMVDETALEDYEDNEAAQPFDSVIQWPWLDCGEPGRSKNLVAFDVSFLNPVTVDVQIGFDQGDGNAFTTAYSVPGETVPGTVFPMPLLAASFAPRLTIPSYANWQLQSFTLYFNDNRVSS